MKTLSIRIYQTVNWRNSVCRDLSAVIGLGLTMCIGIVSIVILSLFIIIPLIKISVFAVGKSQIFGLIVKKTRKWITILGFMMDTTLLEEKRKQDSVLPRIARLCGSWMEGVKGRKAYLQRQRYKKIISIPHFQVDIVNIGSPNNINVSSFVGTQTDYEP